MGGMQGGEQRATHSERGGKKCKELSDKMEGRDKKSKEGREKTREAIIRSRDLEMARKLSEKKDGSERIR